MSNLLIKYHEKQIPVSILCDNQGVQKNVNLFLSTVFAVIGYQISISTLHNMHILSHLDKSFAGWRVMQTNAHGNPSTTS